MLSGLFEEALAPERLEQVITERFGMKQPLLSLAVLKTNAPVSTSARRTGTPKTFKFSAHCLAPHATSSPP